MGSQDDLVALERQAVIPVPVDGGSFNPNAVIPYGLTTTQLDAAMNEFLNFLRFVNEQLLSKGMVRLESLLMPANFSSVVSEFMNTSIPKHCPSLVKNTYHNGHPDLLPANTYPRDSVQYGHTGIEVKASRYLRGWQGHNAEESWLMVFVFDCNRPRDTAQGVSPRPFSFVKVVGAQLEESDWKFAGRSATSRRTITATVTPTGYAKMEANWLYRATNVLPEAATEPDDEGESGA